jgi:SAM-dependent methyltransferase
MRLPPYHILLSSFVAVRSTNCAIAFTFSGESRWNIDHRSSRPLYSTTRRGARSRNKQKGGFGKPKEEVVNEESRSSSGTIYSLPALYDLAFGYRPYEDEVRFLLEAHQEFSRTDTKDQPLRILELAAGPARHSLYALTIRDKVGSATAVDISSDMVEYGQQIARDELGDDRLGRFQYVLADMREFQSDIRFDSAWILLGSLQHMTTNADVIACFRTAYDALLPEGTLVVELPHPRETFSMVECTRNGWQVPLEDDMGNEYGELQIVWGDDNDVFDPIMQVRHFTVSMELKGDDNAIAKGQQKVKEVVPMRLFTAQEIDALAHCSGFEVAAMYGALASDVSVDDEDEAFRLVCVMRKM